MSTTKRKCSLFALNMQELQKSQDDFNLFDKSSNNHSVFGKRSYILTGSDAINIHSENVQKLSNMSKEDIINARKELLQIMNPSHIEFVKSKRKSTATQLECSLENLSIKEKKLPCIPLDLKGKGIHMDVVETEKMRWMENIPEEHHSLPTSLYNARFSFEGELLPYTDKDRSTCDGGLYHHGEEPHRPGYTIEELYQLSRSSVTRQRIIALNALAAILEKEYLLADYLETPLLKQLLDSGIFFILRFSLDEKLRTVYLAALRAISALFWRTIDMHYLFEMNGLFGDLRLPTLDVNDESLIGETANELKDVQLVKLDLIKGALRTNLVSRLGYVVQDALIEVDNLLCVIKCLTRIAYHTDEAAIIILQSPGLLETLFTRCELITACSDHKMYTAKLMVLFRVIVCRSREFALQLNKRLKLLPFLFNVLGSTVTKTSTSSQCIYLWQALLMQRIAHESVSQSVSLLCNFVDHLQGVNDNGIINDGIATFASSLFGLLIYLFERFYETVEFLIPAVEQLCCQWINDFIAEKTVTRPFCKLLANAVFLLSDIQTRNSLRLVYFNAQMKRLTDDEIVCSRIAGKLDKSSFILNANKIGFVSCLPSLCVPMTIFIVDCNCLILTHALVKYNLQNFNCCSHFLRDHFKPYADKILCRQNLSDIAKLWPSRYELMFLNDILTLYAEYEDGECFFDLQLLELAFRLVQIIHADDAHLIGEIFHRVIFNGTLYRRLLSTAMTTSFGNRIHVLDDLNSIESYFVKELNLTQTTNNRDILISKGSSGTESVLPADWHYLPVLKISNMKEKNRVSLSTEQVMPVLKWIYLLEYFCDYIKLNVTVAARYCRICCVFFCGDVFLEHNVNLIMYAILEQLLKRNNELEFEDEIAGVSSFYDFYCDFCEQFASTSYCDPTFCSYLVVPLQQHLSVRFRKYIWIEQPVVLRFLTVPIHRLPLSMHSFLEPHETDPQLIETYFTFIAAGKLDESITPFCYRLALHHITSYIRHLKDDQISQKLRRRIQKSGNEMLLRLFDEHRMLPVATTST